MISVTGSIPASELIVVGGDPNGHVGTNVDGYLFQETEEQIGHLCIWWYSECN